MRPDIRAVVAVGVVLASSGTWPMLTPPVGAQTIRIIERTNARADSTLDRILVANVEEVKRVVATWREREGQLVRGIRASGANDAGSRQRLEEQLALHTRDGFALMSAIQARCIDERVPRPSGYLGVNLTSEFVVENERPKSMGTRVASVEPGSPAERAGVLRNDKVLSIAGLDMRERVPDLSEQLVPGRSVVVRIERQGAPREIALVVAPRPEGFGESCGEFERALMSMRSPGPGGIMAEEPIGERRIVIFRPGGENATTIAFFAGAEFRALDADWGEVLGVRQGVIVNEVANGSSAAQAGLKGGDVITALGRSPVASPVTLVQMLGALKGSEATLSVVRGRERKTVTLRWGPR